MFCRSIGADLWVWLWLFGKSKGHHPTCCTGWGRSGTGDVKFIVGKLWKAIEEGHKGIVVVLRGGDVRRDAVAGCVAHTIIAIGKANSRGGLEIQHGGLARPANRVVVHLGGLGCVLGEGVTVENQLPQLLEAALEGGAARAA